jgi:ABC-type dipeptide/oligopeptide/nickel transport system permease subunit
MSAVVFSAIGADFFTPHFYGDQDLLFRLKPPVWSKEGDWNHVLGTDSLGRDVLSRMIYGARVSMMVALAGVIVSGVIGVFLGLLAGYYGKMLGTIIMRITDIQLTFPPLLLAIAVMAILKPSIINVIIVLCVRSWVIYARTVRGLVLLEKEKEYVTAAVSFAASDWRIMFRHILPNIMGSIIVISTFQLPGLILTEASLSFLGLGVQPPIPSWGEMLSGSREYFSSAWWLVVLPGLAIMITVLGGNLLGDGLRDLLDPRLKLK